MDTSSPLANLFTLCFSPSRYALGHLLTAIQQFEEERVRGQCQNLLRVARRLLGKIGKYALNYLDGWKNT